MDNPTVMGDPGDQSTVYRSVDDSNMLLYSLAEDDTAHVALYVTQREIVLERLTESVALKLPAALNKGSRFSVFARWTPTSLGVWLLFAKDDGTNEEVSAEVEFEQIRLLPREIVRELVRQAKIPAKPTSTTPDVFTPRTSYADSEDFLQTVGEVLSYMRRQLLKIRPTPFWNHVPKRENGRSSQPKNNKKEWVPKDEPQCGDSLFLNLDPLLSLKNISITREDPSRSGLCDFRLAGSLADFRPVRALIELKKAHSADLIHGLTSQLPTYLDEQGIDHGFYGVLWFKGEHWTAPADLTLDECLEHAASMSPEPEANSTAGFECLGVKRRQGW